MTLKSGNPNQNRKTTGFSLVEVLIFVAVLSSVAAAAYLLVSGLTESTKAGKLQSDVVTVNNAVRTYLVNGGKIPAGSQAEAVIAKLKTTSDGPARMRLAGIKGSMLDPRIRGIRIDTPGPERAVWNESKARFEIATSGTGFRAFDLGGDPTVAPVEESRSRTMDLGTSDKWVWDFTDSTVAKSGPREVFTASVASISPETPSTITRLTPPDFSLPGALYDFSSYAPTLNITLADRNLPGEARIFYSIDNGPWLAYQGSPLRIPPQLTSTVRAYAAAVNGENFDDSEIITQKYETIYFTGTSAGNFHDPAGDARLLTNLPAGTKSPNFKWGNPATADKKQNQLDFTGASFANVAPDQEFKLGTLSYYNGTTYSGTNATSVQIAVDLDLTKPGVKETLNFTFKLLSTPNGGRDANADADYVYIPDVSTSFRTTIKGQTFALVLRFGEHSPNGFTTIDTFHAHEGKTLSGTIYGRLTPAR